MSPYRYRLVGKISTYFLAGFPVDMLTAPPAVDGGVNLSGEEKPFVAE
jgi:hypothetical protein